MCSNCQGLGIAVEIGLSIGYYCSQLTCRSKPDAVQHANTDVFTWLGDVTAAQEAANDWPK